MFHGIEKKFPWPSCMQLICLQQRYDIFCQQEVYGKRLSTNLFLLHQCLKAAAKQSHYQQFSPVGQCCIKLKAQQADMHTTNCYTDLFKLTLNGRGRRVIPKSKVMQPMLPLYPKIRTETKHRRRYQARNAINYTKAQLGSGSVFILRITTRQWQVIY